MQTFSFPNQTKSSILALGAESSGNFSVLKNGNIYFSEDFGDLLVENNFSRFQRAVLDFLKKEKIKPNIILTDLHPQYKTTVWGAELAKKFKAEHIQVQHHIAHIFSQLGNEIISEKLQVESYELQDCFGIALDGTGYGFDGKIWGGEVFQISNSPNYLISNKTAGSKLEARRIGHLENQIMIGGELAVREPARMLISILSKFLSKEKIFQLLQNASSTHGREKMRRAGKLYSKSEFELLYNQLQQNFNCVETSSAGRVLDAISVLLGFAENERNFKHEAAYLLEKNSTKPYTDLKPKIDIIESLSISNSKLKILNEFPIIKFPKKYYILNTTYLFKYLIENLHKDKKRLAATAQLYIANGLYEIIKKELQVTSCELQEIILSGGISNNKIIYNYFAHKKTGNSNEPPVIPRSDAGISFGQIMLVLFL